MDKMWKNAIERAKSKKTEIGILLYIVCLFAFFFLKFDVKEYGDSFQFLLQFPTRDPLYSLFLKVCKDIFGETYYFNAIGFIQNTLAVLSIWFLNEHMSKTFSFHKLFKVISVFLLTLPHIVTPVFSSTRLILTNSILTEGISISLFYLWMILMLNLLYKTNIVNDFMALFLALILSMVRGQLLICLIAWIIVMSVKLIIQKKARWIVGCLALCICLLVGRTLFVRNYNNHFWNMYVDTFSGNAMMVANVLYVSEPEDGENIEEPYLKEIFFSVIEKMKEDKMCYSDAGKGLFNKGLFHDKVHDRINFDYFEPAARVYLKEVENLDEMNYMQMMYRVNEIAGELVKELLPNVIVRYIWSYISIVWLGLMRSVAVELGWLVPYVIGVLLLAVSGSIYMLLHKKKTATEWRPAVFMLFVMMMIFGNAMATALMLQCISRYMIYNFPFFYIAFLAMGKELYEGRSRGQMA